MIYIYNINGYVIALTHTLQSEKAELLQSVDYYDFKKTMSTICEGYVRLEAVSDVVDFDGKLHFIHNTDSSPEEFFSSVKSMLGEGESAYVNIGGDFMVTSKNGKLTTSSYLSNPMIDVLNDMEGNSERTYTTRLSTNEGIGVHINKERFQSDYKFMTDMGSADVNHEE